MACLSKDYSTPPSKAISIYREWISFVFATERALKTNFSMNPFFSCCLSLASVQSCKFRSYQKSIGQKYRKNDTNEQVDFKWHCNKIP